MAGTLTITGNEQGLLSGGKTIGPYTITGTATIGQIIDVAIASGDNTLNVPAGATAVLIVVASSNTASLKVRTNVNSTDGGLPIGTAGPCLFGLAAGTTSVIVNATAGGGQLEASFV